MKKRISSLFFLLFTCMMFAQEFNQLDTNGKRHGIWKKNFDGTVVIRYEGTFNHGKEIGLFKFYKNIKNKPVLSATKLFNEKDEMAEVKFLASNGKVISEGQMKGKKYVGTWKYYQKSSENMMTLESYNDEGVLHGERIVYYPNGQIAEQQNYLNGKLEGASTIYSTKNVLLKSFFYVNNELHGPAKFYNPKGELLSEGQYKRGKKDGVWKYFENGKLIREEDFTYIPKYKKKTP